MTKCKTIFKAGKVTARDGQDRNIIVALVYRKEAKNLVMLGAAISTNEHFDLELGKEIAVSRAKSDRVSLKEKNLRKDLFNTDEFIAGNRKILHAIADAYLDEFLYNINSIIWPDNEVSNT